MVRSCHKARVSAHNRTILGLYINVPYFCNLHMYLLNLEVFIIPGNIVVSCIVNIYVTKAHMAVTEYSEIPLSRYPKIWSPLH